MLEKDTTIESNGLPKYLNNDIDAIIACFGGSDGGISFLGLRQFLLNCHNEDSIDGMQILEVVARFARLVRVFQVKKN
jgi:hypothetical protein